MSEFDFDELSAVDALRSCGLRAGDIVFSHSNIGFLGVPRGARTVDNACNTLLSAFLKVLGPSGTLVVPTFTYSFPKGEVFDVVNSPSTCGIFTEKVRTDPCAYRSCDPCVSVAAIGKDARELTKGISTNAYDKESFFGRFFAARGVVCNVNFDAGSTFVHWVERALGVPYRFDKTFSGILQVNDSREHRESTIWVRSKGSEHTRAKFEAFDALAKSMGIFRTAPVGRGSVGLISAHDTFELIRQALPERPWLLTAAEGCRENPILKVED